MTQVYQILGIAVFLTLLRLFLNFALLKVSIMRYCLCTCTHVCICLCLLMCICLSVPVCVRVCVFVSVPLHVSVWSVTMWVHVYNVYMYMYVSVPKGGTMALLHPLVLLPHPLILKFMLKNTVS